MNLLKRIVSYSPYLLILFVVPVFADAQGVGEAIHGGIKNVLWTFVNNIFGTLIAWAGITLDYAVNQYVIGFGSQWRGGVGGAIDMSWGIVRDVFNITFIFGLIWLGFKMILNSGDSSTRRTLITLIMAALLVNFSLFITKFVVDFTNILSTEIAQSFIQSDASEVGESSADGGDGVEISQAFMQLFGLTGVWQSPAGAPNEEDDMSGVSYMYIFGTAIVFLIGAFTFATGAIMLIIRFAALCIFMVFSPLMFLGWVFPGMQSVSSKYWSGFLGRAFYAPAYLMLIYLAAFVMGSYNDSASGFRAATSQRGNSFNGDTFGSAAEVSQIASTLGPFLLTCVFLIASVVVAGKMSADGAATTIKMGQNIRRRTQNGLRNGAKNTAVWTGRTASAPVRKAGRSLDNATGNKINSYLDKKQQQDGRILGFGPKARNLKVDETLRSQAQKFKESKNGEKYTVDEAAKKQAAINSRAEASAHIAAGIKSDATPDQKAKMQSAVSNLTQAQLENMPKETLLAITPYLKANQFEKYIENENVSADSKDAVYKARKEAIKKIVGDSAETLRENIGKLSIKQIETMGAQWAEENAHLFSKDQMDGIKKSDSFIEEQKGSIIGKRKSNMVTEAKSQNAVQTLIAKQKPSEIAQYPAAVLSTTKVAAALKPDVLKQIVKKDSLTATEMTFLREQIEKDGLSETKDYLKSPQGRKDWYDGKELITDSNSWDDPVT